MVLPGPRLQLLRPLAAINATGHTWNHGWYAGAGFEYVVHKGPLVDVILGAEYQHFELHSKTAFCFNPGCAIVGPQDHINFEHKARMATLLALASPSSRTAGASSGTDRLS